MSSAFNQLIKTKFDSVIPIVAYSFPIQRALRLSKGKVLMIDEKKINFRSQDLDFRYHDAGQFYWCNTIKLLKNKKLINSNTGGIGIL